MLLRCVSANESPPPVLPQPLHLQSPPRVPDLLSAFIRRQAAGLAIALGCLLPVPVQALIRGPAPAAPRLYLHAGTLAPPPLGANRESALAFLKSGEQTVLIQFSGPVQAAWKTAVEREGVRLLRYLPDFGYVARGNASALRRASGLPFLRWIGPYLPDYRLSPVLPDSGPTTAVVALESFADPDAVRGSARTLGLEVESAGTSLVRLRGDAERIRVLAEREDVVWIAPVPSLRPLNDRSRVLVGVNAVWSDLGLQGEGQIIGIADTGLDTGDVNTLSADFQGRVEQGIPRVPGRDWADDFGHGTHIAGIIAGQGKTAAGPPDPQSFAGVAPRAKLVVQGFELDNTGYHGFPEDLNELFEEAYQTGARVHNDSWGDGSAPYGSYSLYTRHVDEFIWNHPDMNIVFAAGNSGHDSPTWGRTPYETDRMNRLPGDGIIKPGSLEAPGTAKNALTVGASEGDRPPQQGWSGYSNSRWSLWGYKAAPISADYTSDRPNGLLPTSSRGPTADGRIKPDLVAPGSNIISTASSIGSHRLWGPHAPGYAYNGGTSISAGFVSGAAALVRQWYQERHALEPSAALVKATLLNGARELAPGQYGDGPATEIPPRPNGAEGWGRVDVANALQPPAPSMTRFRDEKSGLGTGEERTWLLNVRPGESPLRIMLVWSDYPGSVNAAVALVNDLDLTVTGPEGTPHRGNGAEDRRNNVEAVELSALAPGAYRVSVRGYNVPQGPQPFALAAQGAVSPFLLPGDADLNGAVNVADAVRALQGAIGVGPLSEDATVAGDLNRNGDSARRVDVSDAVAILRLVAGLPL